MKSFRTFLYRRLALVVICLTGSGPLIVAQSLAEVNDALARYDVAAAADMLDHMEEASQPRGKKKKPLPEGYEAIRSEYKRISSALERVEMIEVIDSVSLDKRDFFLRIPLSASAGRFMAPSALPPGVNAADSTAVYMTEDASVLIYAAPDKSGRLRLMETYLLSDGSYAPPAALRGELGEGDINWGWLAPDGITLYYSARGNDDSLGGYDIYMTRREDGEFLLPQSLGMPYNSAANDLLYVIDEERGLGYWATDRNAAPGKVTLYTFIPSELRRNYPPDTPSLASLALLTDYRSTLTPGKDYTQAEASLRQARLSHDDNVRKRDTHAWALEIPGVGIITSLHQLRSPQARELMAELLDLEADARVSAARLASLRRAYGRGNTEVASEILDAEARADSDRDTLMKLRNEVIRAESSMH